MFKKFLSNNNYKYLTEAIDEGYNVSVFGLNLGEKLALFSDSAFLFYVVENLDNVNIVLDKLTGLGRKCGVLTSPITPFTSEFASTEESLKILCSIKNNSIDTLILTPEIITAKFPNPNSLEVCSLKKDDELNIPKFIKKLVDMGYARVDLVEKSGQFSVRGDIIDIYPIASSPIRIFTEYDEVESIKYYNAITMLTTTDIDKIDIFSNRFCIVQENDIIECYANYKKDDIYYYKDKECTQKVVGLIRSKKKKYVKGGILIQEQPYAITEKTYVFRG